MRLLAVAAFSLLLGAPAAAQNPLRADCDSRAVMNAVASPEWTAIHPRALLAPLPARPTSDDWLSYLSSVRVTVAPFLARAEAANAADVALFRSQLDSTIAEFARIRGSADSRSLVARSAGVHNTRFRITQEMGDVVGVSLFALEPRSVRFSLASPMEVRRPLCWTAIALDSALLAYAASGEDMVVAEMRRLGALWDNLAESGFRPTMLEFAANSLGRRPDMKLEPPRRLLIVAHPGVGQLRAKAPAETERRDVAIFDFGLLQYFRDRREYAIVAAGVTAGKDIIGVGPHIQVRGISLGYAWNLYKSDQVGHGVFGSADLFSLIGGGASWALKHRRAADESIRAALDSARVRPGGGNPN